MSWLPRERQPFVGLAIAAAVGIVAADYFPALNFLVVVIAVCGALFCLRWPFAPLVFSVVASAFFCVHSSRILSASAQALAEFAGNEIRAVSVTGSVATEPKIEPNGVATFLLELKDARLDDQIFATDAIVYVHWRGSAQVGDELALRNTCGHRAAAKSGRVRHARTWRDAALHVK